MKRQSPQDVDLETIEYTCSDLELILEKSNKHASSADLRLLSVSLRKILLYNMLQKCWSLLGMEPAKPTLIANKVDPNSLLGYEFAFAGDVVVGGMRFAMLNLSHGVSGQQKTVEPTIPSYHFNVDQFCKSCILAVGDVTISRGDVVKYIAHKKGGSHHDPKRKEEDVEFKALDSIRHHRAGGTVPSTANGVPLFRNGRLALSGSLRVVDLAMLSISQSIASSPDVKRLVDACRRTLEPHQM